MGFCLFWKVHKYRSWEFISFFLAHPRIIMLRVSYCDCALSVIRLKSGDYPLSVHIFKQILKPLTCFHPNIIAIDKVHLCVITHWNVKIRIVNKFYASWYVLKISSHALSAIYLREINYENRQRIIPFYGSFGQWIFLNGVDVNIVLPILLYPPSN